MPFMFTGTKRERMVKKFTAVVIVLVAFYVPARNSLWQGIIGKSKSKKEATVQMDPKWVQLTNDYQRWVQQSMAIEGIPGAAVAIVKDSNVMFLEGFGVKKVGTTDSVDIHTVFRLASLSKGFASVLTAEYVESGCLNWDDQVRSYVPYLELRNKKHADGITLRHVLSHTTGLPRHTFSNMLNQGVYYDDILQRLKEVRITHPLGTTYNYQNVLYSLVGDVMYAATDKSYARLLGERIFTPAGMDDASATFDAMLETTNIAHPHDIRRDGSYETIDISRNYYEVIPAAGVNASIADMACWLQVLMGNRPDIISQKALNQIFTPQVEVNLKEMRDWQGLRKGWYGMGWRILDFDNKMLIYHGGFVNGYRTEIAFDPREKVGIVVLSNSVSHFIGDSVEKFFEMYEDMDEAE